MKYKKSLLGSGIFGLAIGIALTYAPLSGLSQQTKGGENSNSVTVVQCGTSSGSKNHRLLAISQMIENSRAAGVRIAFPTQFHPYTASESFKWARDFIVSPSSAKDRQIVYAYELSGLTSKDIKEVTKAISANSIKTAIINTGVFHQMNGEDGVFFGTPVLAGKDAVPTIEKYMRKIVSPDLEERKLALCAIANIVTLGSLRASGVRVQDESAVLTLPVSSRSYIGLSEALPLSANPIPLVASKGAWTEMRATSGNEPAQR